MRGRMWGRASIAACALLAGVLLLAPLGCGGGAADGGASRDTSHGEDGWSWTGEEAEEENGGETPAPADRTIYMCGRSVLGGWFDHWGWDYDPMNPVRFDGHYLVYREMDVPPGIADTAADAARAAAGAGVRTMFFKLCFADFTGGDEDSARENLRVNQGIIRDVVESAVEEEGLTLILGNALPMVREYTDEWLVWNHREYNRFLEELAVDYGGRVIILDLYGTLAAPEGWLLPRYASDPYDSHLSGAAYDALDSELEEVLGG
ncbi:MAG: SGNH/GDSL hydrolase family protein [Actinomycetota bacterium]